jgi:hypothetical protein
LNTAAPPNVEMWLTNAETMVQVATKIREYIQGIVEKYGPDAKMIG